MVHFKTTILKFGDQGEKTGWTYIHIPAETAGRIKPGNKKTFRVKGKLDNYAISGVALLPIGGGDFIMPVNGEMRKGIKKTKGTEVSVQLEEDQLPVLPPAEFAECLQDEPQALEYFNSLTKGHQNYFIKWMESAKTEQTKTKRIADAINGLSNRMDFGQLIRSLKQKRSQLLG